MKASVCMLNAGTVGYPNNGRPASTVEASHLSSVKAIVGEGVPRSCRQSTRARRPRIRLQTRSEMGGEYDDTFDDVSKHLTDLFTYKAVRRVLDQLKETDPVGYRYLYEFTVENKPSNSFEYCKILVKNNYELGGRVLDARLALLAQWMEQLPSQREQILLHVRDTNLDVLRGHIKDSVNLAFTAKPRPDLNE
ncbi:hypothetical protein BSKO_09409 [Bryopsis sp. KO-2023]|nr:hypothetical protein BSKO_09409 [Bryopsis sp. KO-2023]